MTKQKGIQLWYIVFKVINMHRQIEDLYKEKLFVSTIKTVSINV